MKGPFDGTLAHADGVTREALPQDLAAALARAQTDAWPRAEAPPGDDAARAVFFSFDADEGVTYQGDLSGWRSWPAAALPKTEALAALARVGRCLERLHARGVVHGDLRPEVVWLGEANGVALLVPARASAPGAVLRARLHPGGAPAACVGFAAPEAVAGFEATAAADVYGLAAIAYAALTGYAPLGQVNLQSQNTGAHAELARCVDAALNQVPAVRPTTATLAATLEEAARAAQTAESTQAAPYRSERGSVASAAEAASVRRQAAELSPVLMMVLILGGLCAFVGAVLLVVAGWDVVGQYGRVVLLGGLAAVSWAAGGLAARRGLDTGAVVGRGLGGLFATVALAYGFYLLDDPGRLLLLIALTGGAFAGGVAAGRRGAPAGGAVLLALGTQLLWSVGAQALHMLRSGDDAGSIAALAGAVTAVTYALALHRRSLVFSVLAALDSVVCAAALGEFLKTGAVMGPSAYTLAVAAAYAGLAALARRQDAAPAAPPMALGALLAAWVSAILGLWVMSEHWATHGVQGAAWPFLVAALAAALTRARPPLGPMATLGAVSIVALAPTIEALVRDELAFALLAVLVGALTLVGALLVPGLRPRDDARVESVLAGLFSLTASTDLRLLRAIDRSNEGWLAHGAGTYWALMGAVSAGLLALSYAVTSRVSRARYRLLEVTALAQLYLLLTLQVVVTRHEAQPAALALASSAALLTLGVVTRRAAVMVLSAVALIVNLWVQYFVRLEDVFPLSVRLVGFGVGLLVGGVIYEQQVRGRLAQLRDWN